MPHDHPDHDHISASGHPYRPDNDHPLTHWQTMEIAVREILIEKGVTTTTAINSQVEAMDKRAPADGAKVVARAWTDSEFKARLLADGSTACEEMGFPVDVMKLVVVENTDDIHNIIVCTLCSCYPRNLIGLPPEWYKTRAYRSRTVREPREVLSEFGLNLPDNVQVRVHDSTADMRYLVLPARPEWTQGWNEEALAAVVSRDCMIGTAVPVRPG